MASSTQPFNHGGGPPMDIPANVNPFAFLIETGRRKFSSPFSTATTIGLGILLIFHTMIMILCLFILILTFTSRSEQSRWLFRKLYIKDGNGEKIYKKPLYLLNCGLLMNISQLLCSSVAQAYIWMQIRSSRSADYAVHAQIVPCFGLISIFETLTHWSMTHCFLITIYFSRGLLQESKSAASRWISPPLIINFFFVGFPVCVTIVTIALMSWTSFVSNRFPGRLLEWVACLNRGSWVWQSLHDGSHSDEDKAQLGIQLAETMSDMARIGGDLGSLAERFVNAFRLFQGLMAVFVFIGCTVFVGMFCLLIGKTGRQPGLTKAPTEWFPSWLKRESFGDLGMGSSDNTSGKNISVILPNKQFFYLLLRALGIFFSMITQMAVLLLGALKTREIMTHTNWRGVTTWLVTLSSVWSAAPIAWQCWKLYAEEAKKKSDSVTEEIAMPSKGNRPSSFRSDDGRDTKFDIHLPSKNQEPFTRQNACELKQMVAELHSQ